MNLPRSFCSLVILCLLPVTARSADPISITHGPMLGRPSATGMGVWARTSREGSFYVQYGLAPDKLTSQSAAAKTQLADDNTGVVMLTDLEPGTRYYYRVVAGEPKAAGDAAKGRPDAGKTGGSFRTWRDSAALRDPELNPKGLFNFKFEFACGNNQAPEHGAGPSLPTYDTLLAKVKNEVDFAILNGDWVYEESRDYPVQDWLGQVGIAAANEPRLVKLAPTIVGVWENYKVYLARGKNLSEWHRHVPSFYTFDDHEIVNDVFGTGTPGFRHRRTVFRDIAVQGWYDYLGWSNPTVYQQPIHFGRAKMTKGSDILTDPEADFTKLKLDAMGNLHVHWGTATAGVNDLKYDNDEGNPNSKVYAIAEVLDAGRLKISPAAVETGEVAYSIGRRSYGKFRMANCEFFLVDTRSHRSLHDLKQPAKKGVSMLGPQQTKWLTDEMKRSDADFLFVVSSVNFMVPHVGAGGFEFDAATKDDAWTVFLDERERLINLWDDLKQPVFVLTGDLHNSFAIKVTDNVWEFASGPHNSVNHTPNDEGGRPANGPFKYGPRACDIRWSSYVKSDIDRPNRLFPHYCLIQVNNVFNNPQELGGTRRVAFPRPQVIFQYYDGRTGDLRYAEAIQAADK